MDARSTSLAPVRHREGRGSVLEFKFTQGRIEEVSDLIRPFIRKTPTVEVQGEDFEIGSMALTLKLETLSAFGFLQSAGCIY